MLVSAASLGDHLLVVSSRAAVDSVELWDTDGTIQRTIEEFRLISVQSVDTDDDYAFLTVASFDAPSSLFRLTAGRVERWSVRPDA